MRTRDRELTGVGAGLVLGAGISRSFHGERSLHILRRSHFSGILFQHVRRLPCDLLRKMRGLAPARLPTLAGQASTAPCPSAVRAIRSDWEGVRPCVSTPLSPPLPVPGPAGPW
ncbi:hypothetical protein GCM10010267_16470 [Streptomyces griseorubens]|nr:hypothetical protein GCM10010267_16470 [Streptomyces griseorubens]